MSAVLVIPGRTKGTKGKKRGGGGRETVSFYCHINNVDHTGENRKKVRKTEKALQKQNKKTESPKVSSVKFGAVRRYNI